VGNSTYNSVTVLLGNGDGSFQTPSYYPAGSEVNVVKLADLNGDGNLDLVAVNGAGLGGTSGASVLLGNGDGTFQPAVTYAAGRFPQDVAVGDFNGDGIPDLALASLGDGTVVVLLGHGDGTFDAGGTYLVGPSAYSVDTADFNGDGNLDLALANQGNGTVSVLLGNGDGSFETPLNYAVGMQPIYLVTGDFNGDGFPDLAVANQGESTLSVLLNAADWSGPTSGASGVRELAHQIASGEALVPGATAAVVPSSPDGHLADRLLATAATGPVGSRPASTLPALGFEEAARVEALDGDGWLLETMLSL
jgi:hypothetical protein